ncbi:hypothetical protein RND81_04G070700 [Saponaria officinalis]|uniref:Uncharacterized protein n=2 Tax=Saponaria officinalis TaxID=3572 RepID=A0AAW1LD16_SAPOF
MNSGQANTAPITETLSGKKVRKPYTITKSRESWTDEEHDKFLEALHLFDRDWKKIEDFIGSKTVIQIRSHAQKYFLKVQKNGTVAHVPPPRPKRKAAHPYPQKAHKNVLVPSDSATAFSVSFNPIAHGFPTWDDGSVLMNQAATGNVPSQDEDYLDNAEDAGAKGFPGNIGTALSEIRRLVSVPDCDLSKQGKSSALHGLPDFVEVYSFIGSVFDPDSKDHAQKLKEMDPINFETVLLLMQNLTMNLSSPDFEPVWNILSSYNASTETATPTDVGVAEKRPTYVAC